MENTIIKKKCLIDRSNYNILCLLRVSETDLMVDSNTFTAETHLNFEMITIERGFSSRLAVFRAHVPGDEIAVETGLISSKRLETICIIFLLLSLVFRTENLGRGSFGIAGGLKNFFYFLNQ